MKILLTGGSGFIGSYFNEMLENHEVVNFDLRAPIVPTNNKWIEGDIRKSNQVENALEGCDAIIHLAAMHHDFGISQEEYFDTNENGMKVLTEEATKKGIKKFVFYSSVAVYGEEYPETDESSEPHPCNDYGASKLAGEAVLKKWASEDSSREVLIIRPCVVYGERNKANMYFLIRQIDSGRYFNIGKGDNVKSICYVRNIVAATIHHFEKIQPGVELFNYVDEPQLESRKISNIISNGLSKKESISIPYWFAYLLGIPFDILIAVTGKNLPVSTKRIKKFCTSTRHGAKKMHNSGFKAKYSNEEGIKNMVAWYLTDK